MASGLDLINREVSGDSLVASIVAGVVKDGDSSADAANRTYRITVSPPLGRSFARDIAARYGISFEQLSQTLIERNVITEKNVIKESSCGKCD